MTERSFITPEGEHNAAAAKLWPYEYVEWLRKQQGGRCTCGKCDLSR